MTTIQRLILVAHRMATTTIRPTRRMGIIPTKTEAKVSKMQKQTRRMNASKLLSRATLTGSSRTSGRLVTDPVLGCSAGCGTSTWRNARLSSGTT